MYGSAPALKKISPDAFNNAVRCHTIPARSSAGLTKVTNANLQITSTNNVEKKSVSPAIGHYKLKYDPATFQTVTATTTAPTTVVSKLFLIYFNFFVDFLRFKSLSGEAGFLVNFYLYNSNFRHLCFV